ncbi:Pba1p PWA37_004276 [Arxiozyma heterogenica]|uniref:Pba1p n=1 Tax=Arxiozyma heterogenica TaxID=278026 RepID=UPI002EDBBBF6
MNPLFHSIKSIRSKIVGYIESSLTIPKELLSKTNDFSRNLNQNVNTLAHSWDYNENFPNQFDPDLDETNGTTKQDKLVQFKFPIVELSNDYSNNDFNTILLISIGENLLKFSPIFSNVIAQELISKLSNYSNEIIIIGTSDKIYQYRAISLSSCTLQLPEFLTGVCASLIHYLINLNMNNFKGHFVPSEGPTGFEKLSITSMDTLIDISINELISTIETELDIKNYRDECHRNWKLDGAAMSTQSGLYI